MQQLEADIVIVAAGTAGLSAAVAAAERGAKVIMFEKASTTGGTGNMAGGPFAVESRLQRLRKIAITREEVFKIFMEHAHWLVDARLVRAYIDKSASTIDWLEKMGIEFIDVACHNMGFQWTWHVIKGPAYPRRQPGTAAAMMKVLTERARELGVKILLRTPAKKILKEGGHIRGVMAEDESGEQVRASARAVIIATGGFCDNTEMLKKYTGYEWGSNLFMMRIPGLTGDGIRMAWEVGAAQTKMLIHSHSGVPDIQEFFTVDFTFHQPNLIVNVFGERFMNEEIIQTTPFGANPITRQKDRCAFLIFDEDTKKYYQEKGLDFPPGNMVSDTLVTIDNFDAELEKILAQNNKQVYVADSLEELASKTGINQITLQKTIDEYNRACETGRDELFNKNPRYLKPVRQPKYYAGKLYLHGSGTLGGIKINHKTEVLTEEFDIIPGLYAAGNDANSIYGDTYLLSVPGNTLGFALNSGRIAGENAAEYVKSN